MIESVKRIATVKASDLPPTFDIRVGSMSYPFELVDAHGPYVHMRDLTNDEIVNVPSDFALTILIPDSLESSRFDIEMDLMQKGLI